VCVCATCRTIVVRNDLNHPPIETPRRFRSEAIISSCSSWSRIYTPQLSV